MMPYTQISEDASAHSNIAALSSSNRSRGLIKEENVEEEDIVLVSDGNGNMVDPSFITRKYLGVTYHKRNKKWIAQASENGRSKYLGCFKTPEKAARMYDAYVVSQGGESVKTNFPVSEIDPNLKPLVKRYRKRSREVVQNLQQIPSLGNGPLQQMNTDSWDSYMSGLTNQCIKRRKRTRDPSAPKGPRNAYMMYIQKNREKVQKECEKKPLEEGNSFGAISRELGRRWKALTPDKRKEFEDLAALDKIRYEKEKEQYEQKLENENKITKEAIMSNLDTFQQHYNEYAQIQQQWLQMMGYGTPVTNTQIPENSSINQYFNMNNMNSMKDQMSSQPADIYELGYTNEEIRTLQKAYYQAAQQGAFDALKQCQLPDGTTLDSLEDLEDKKASTLELE